MRNFTVRLRSPTRINHFSSFPSVLQTTHLVPTLEPPHYTIMAIIPGLEGLEVTVLVSGTPAKEYERSESEHSSNEDVPHSIKYIEAVPGAPFGIYVKKAGNFRQTSHHIGFRIVIDGKECGFVEEKGLEIEKGWTKQGRTLVLTDEVGKLMRMDHRFGDPQDVGHPEQLLDNGVNTHSYGTIRVYFYRLLDSEGRAIPRQIPASRPSMGTTRTSQRDANRRELSLLIQYPALAPITNSSMPATLFQEPSRQPFAVFEFCYEYRGNLVQAGIVPPEDIVNASYEERVQDLCSQLLSANIVSPSQA